MRWMLLLLSLMLPLPLPLPVAGQVTLISVDAMDTRFGRVAVVGPIGANRLTLDGVPIEGVENWGLRILGSFALADEPFDYLLVSDHGGGNACDPPIRLLRIAQSGPVVGPLVGGCVYPMALDVRLFPGRIEIDTPHRDLGIAREVFSWDGTALQSREVAEAAATVAPGDPRQWVGQHPYAALDDAAERVRFGQIMRDWQIEELATRLGPANSVIERDGWVLGAGCMAHNCNTRRGVWGIRIADGVPAAATMDVGLSARSFGTAANDPVFRAWIEENMP
ncbi:hypothetical protein A8B78_10010 [Jannaschia sp. EhC01]|nr:hypothetical protein A8B78_10010 [Jannaschia sp. EhC01]